VGEKVSFSVFCFLSLGRDASGRSLPFHSFFPFLSFLSFFSIQRFEERPAGGQGEFPRAVGELCEVETGRRTGKDCI